MLRSELIKLNKIIDGSLFTPVYEVESYKPIKDSEDNIIDFELIGFVLKKTAEENYDESNQPKDMSINPIDTLILDNIKMQMQIDQLIASQLGGK